MFWSFQKQHVVNNGLHIFCGLCHESSRYQFPNPAKDRSVVPPVRSSDPFLSEPKFYYQPFNVTFKCERTQLYAVCLGGQCEQ